MSSGRPILERHRRLRRIERAPARPRRRLARAVAVALAMIMATSGLLATMASAMVHDRLLSATLYTDALDAADAYERFYQDVLTDPAVLAATERLLASLDITRADIADVRAVTAAGTRLVFPPVLLRELATQLVDGTMRYLRGDVAVITSPVELSDVLTRATDGLFVQLAAYLAEASSHVFADVERYRTAVHAFADELAQGRVPASVPVMGGSSFSVDDALDAIDRATRFGLPAPVRAKVQAALASGESRDALVDALLEYLALHVERTLADAARGALGRPDVEALSALAGETDLPAGQFIEQVNRARGTVQLFPSWAGTAGLALFAVGSAALLASARKRPSRALLGLAVVVGCAAVGAIIACSWAGDRLQPALAQAASAHGATVPPSVQAIVEDVNAHVVDELRGAAASAALLPMVMALGATIVVTTPTLVRRHGVRRPTALSTAALMLAAAAVGSGATPRTTSADAPQRCNGHVELCDRRYDEVVQAATHNAMSSPDIVAVWPEQDRGIRAQLDFGVRALLVDTKYWHPTDPPSGLTAVERFLPARLLDAVFNPRRAPRRAKAGTYLCHESCALGAIELTSALTQVREFLDDNPNEVVTLIVQNEVSAADTSTAFMDAGLERYLYAHHPDEAWPTLGELVSDGNRLVVFSEVETPAPDWNHPAFTYFQDTPYKARAADELSCDRYRGEATASLFLMNHWVRRKAPDRADARLINTRDAIVSRARACAAERGQLPDVIAVDFYSLGDVIGAVDELNGLSTLA